MIIDLSQTISNDMPGFRLRDASGNPVQFAARIKPFLTHEQSRPNYHGKAEFEITEVAFHTSIGTYLDAPRHRFAGMADIADLPLEGLILNGIVVDGSMARPGRPLSTADIPEGTDLRNRAVLINFGWDRHWGSDAYYDYPYADRGLIEYFILQGAKLIGVDTINVDTNTDPERPAHTWLLQRGIHIVENLTGLAALSGKRFRFFAIPAKVAGAVAFPIRAFAEIEKE